MVIVGLKSVALDRNGMVMDFGDIKAIGENYFKELDHATMINRSDHENVMPLRKAMPFLKIVEVAHEPTAENMARDAYYYFVNELVKYDTLATMDFITIYETDKSQATYSED
jgi:6-pyruvoyl-tetrahydropterin synthase